MKKFNANYRPDLDGLRALSILAVLGYHAKLPGFAHGFLGVDVFFVLSGFFITQLLFYEIQKTGSISYQSFYLRRLRRLLPAILLVSTTCVLVWCISLADIHIETKHFIRSVQTSLWGFANFFFLSNSGGYFDLSSEYMPFLHFWSLAVEEQFYIFWPALLIGITKIVPGEDKKKGFLLICILVLLLSLGLFIGLTGLNKESVAFYMMPSRCWQLAVGAILVFFPEKPFSKIPKNLFSLISLVSLLTLIFILLSNLSSSNFIFLHFGTCLFTAFVIRSNLMHLTGFVPKFLGNRVLVYVGLISYSLYLWHWPILVFSQLTPESSFLNSQGSLYPLLLSFALAAMTYHLVENPVRRAKFFENLSNKKVIGWSLGSLILLTISVEIVLKLLPRNDSKFFNKVTETSVLANKCIDAKDFINLSECSITHSNPSAILILLGDSHASSLVPLVEKMSEAFSLNTFIFTHSSTAPLSPKAEHFHEKIINSNEKKKFIDLSFSEIKKITQSSSLPVVVFLSGRWVGYAGKDRLDKEKTKNSADNSKRRMELLDALEVTIEDFKSMGVSKVLIQMPGIEFEHMVSLCKKKNKCFVTRDEFEDFRASTVKIFTNLEKKYPDFIKTMDMVPVFCNEKFCQQIQQDQDGFFPVVQDRHHLSVYASSTVLWNSWKSDLEKFFQLKK